MPKQTEQAITEGVATIVDESADEADLLMRVERLAMAAPLSAGQTAYQDAAHAHGLSAWVRRTDADPCDLCKFWADGKARPYSVKMARHPGCGCVAEPVQPGRGTGRAT